MPNVDADFTSLERPKAAISKNVAKKKKKGKARIKIDLGTVKVDLTKHEDKSFIPEAGSVAQKKVVEKEESK